MADDRQWVANGKFGWDYNRLYDLYYRARVPLGKQRVASPFISAAQESLVLYRIIDPDMWGKMICRVNGVNFTAIYGHTNAVARYRVSLPEETRRNYLAKLAVSIDFWRHKGGCLSDRTIENLRKAGVSIKVQEHTNYRTSKKPVRMEYMDDINLPDFKDLPTYKRVCICILKNDHMCKYMGFALNKYEQERKREIMEFYYNLYT